MKRLFSAAADDGYNSVYGTLNLLVCMEMITIHVVVIITLLNLNLSVNYILSAQFEGALYFTCF